MRQNAKTRHFPLGAAPPAPQHRGPGGPTPHGSTLPEPSSPHWAVPGGRGLWGAGGRRAPCMVPDLNLDGPPAPQAARGPGDLDASAGRDAVGAADCVGGGSAVPRSARLHMQTRQRHARTRSPHADTRSPLHTCACSQDTRAPAPRLHSGTRADTRANTPRTHRHTRRPATQTRTSRRPRGPACWGAHAVTCAGSPCSPHSPHTLRHAGTPMQRHMRPYTAPAAGPGEGGRPGWGQLRRRPAAGPAMDGGWWACRALDRRRDPRDVVGAGVGLARPRLRPPAGGSGLRGRRTRLGHGHPQPRGRSQARWPSGQPHRSARPSPSEPIRPWAPVWPLCPPPKRAAQPGSVPSSRCLW